jgi:hypothetical protein
MNFFSIEEFNAARFTRHRPRAFTSGQVLKKLTVSIGAGKWKRVYWPLVQAFLRSYIFPALDCHQVDERENS